MRVLLVENHVPKALDTFFKAEGLVVEHTDTGQEALSLLRHYSFDVMVLNQKVPDMDAALLISRIRAAGHHIPVLVVFGSASGEHRLAALSAGADDVVDHDMDRAELLARMRAIQRRSRGYSQPVIRWGKLTLDQESQQVTIDDKHVHLTHTEFALLQLLMMRKNMTTSKEAILSNLYGGIDEPEIKIIDVFVCKVRSKLAKSGLCDLIQTVWGRGYVVRDAPRDDDAAPEPLVPQPIEASRREPAFV